MSAEIHYEYNAQEWYAECQSCGWQSEFYSYKRDAEDEAEDHDMALEEEHKITQREKFQKDLDLAVRGVI